MGNGEKYIPVLESALGVKNLTLIAEKPLIHGNVIYKGELNGVKCVVKYSVNDPDSVRCEYECAKRLYAGMPEHIVKPLAFAPIADGAAYVGEWIDGQLLYLYLPNTEITDAELRNIVSQIDKITDYFLSVGFAHRDFVPANVIRDNSGVLKVIDFQNSGFVGDEDFSVKKAFREIRSYIYSYCTNGFGAGTFNDRVHFLTQVDEKSSVYEALVDRWRSKWECSSLHFHVSIWKYVYMLGNFPMLIVKNIFEKRKSKKLKLKKKLTVTYNTFVEFFRGGGDEDLYNNSGL